MDKRFITGWNFIIMTFITAELPKIYWLKKITFICNDCGLPYDILMPVSDELVKFVEKNGFEERWLPTYGKGGYLDLVENLIDNFKKSGEITAEIAKDFEKKFCNFQQLSTKGNSFTTIFHVVCPDCESKDNKVSKEEVIKNPDILWLNYDLRR